MGLLLVSALTHERCRLSTLWQLAGGPLCRVATCRGWYDRDCPSSEFWDVVTAAQMAVGL